MTFESPLDLRTVQRRDAIDVAAAFRGRAEAADDGVVGHEGIDAGRDGDAGGEVAGTGAGDAELRCSRVSDPPGVRGFAAGSVTRKAVEPARQDADTRWARVAEAAGIGIVQVDLVSGRIDLDPLACAQHGLPSPHPPATLAGWLAAIDAEDRPSVDAALQPALERGGRFETRCRIRRADGSRPWLEFVGRVDVDLDGRPVSMIGSCRDVSAAVAADLLQREKDAAERAGRAKSDFLSRVSHELRTPLNGILGFAQLMALDQEHALAGPQKRRLDGVHRSGQHLLALVNDMLDIARIGDGDFAPQRVPTDLVDVVGACLAMARPLAVEHGVGVVDGLPATCWVLADARPLEQVLMNLLSNAIKFNLPGGGVRLELTQSAGRVALSVEDDGPGLDAQQQAQLFQPFNRLGAERQRIEGTGLGLVIARQLARAMQGDLTVESHAGSGCRFTLHLAAAAVPDADRPTVSAFFRDTSTPPPGPPRCVLYIEDEPLNIVLMEEVFRHHAGLTLHTARDGAEGLELAQELLPDLALIDINLPDMSGIQIVGRLRSQVDTAGLHCIALSADAMQEQVAEALAAGFDDYWTKPINVARLMETLQATLARGRAAG